MRAHDNEINVKSLRRFQNRVIRKSLEQQLMRFHAFFPGLFN
jgi:hypothetical protein